MRTSLPKVMILTAGYGDGHNSAARGIAGHMEGRFDCRVLDVFALAMPGFFKVTRKGYLWTIANAPALWRMMYDWSDSMDMSVESMAVLAPVASCLESEIKQWEPDLIICTYMVYPYMLDRFFKKTGKRMPYLTVVTDSLEVNKTWICSGTDAWAVTDEWTRQVMVERGLDASRIFVSGFPVSPVIHKLARENVIDWKNDEKFRVLYFPQGKRTFVEETLKSLLLAHENIVVTCVLGRHVRKYYRRLSRVKEDFQGRVILKGWTRKVPQLMSSHHLVIGKAGGATSHECMAMGRPMLVNFMTPGQEEGNIRLLEKLGGGRFVETPMDLKQALTRLLENDGELWQRMKRALSGKTGMGSGTAVIEDWCSKQIFARTNG